LTEPADLDIVDMSALLRRGALSARELLESCLARTEAPTLDGASDAVNAFVRVYSVEARVAASHADAAIARARRRAEVPGALWGIPLALKDLFAVAGRPLTASSRVADLAPTLDSEVWRRLAAAGMILIGHAHTHEWAAGGSTDQVGNPWALDRSAGGSSGGSAAALAARIVPAATGTDTAGSLRIPSALCGTSAIKPSRGAVPLDGVVPLAWSLDHAGPMARTVQDCRALLAAMHGAESAFPTVSASLAGVRFAISPRLAGIELDADVSAGFADAIAAARSLGATIVEPPLPDGQAEVVSRFFDVLGADMLSYHQRFADRREHYRPSTRELLELAAQRDMSLTEYGEAQLARLESSGAWSRWLRDERIDVVLEPTVAFVAPVRGSGYDSFVVPDPYTVLTYFWDWTGFPVVALPAGLGASSGLPVGVSLIGGLGTDDRLAALAQVIQHELGVPSPTPGGRRASERSGGS
jgi:aspartyl-tRNA(Asn)/glutamyl-tRNA(Gln) amidotransferase subunit A